MNASLEETKQLFAEIKQPTSEQTGLLVPQKPSTQKCPVTIGEQKKEREFHMKYVPTVIDCAPLHLLDDFNCLKELPRFKLAHPWCTDLSELVKNCTFYTRDEIFSIMEFSQRNQKYDYYLWKKIENQSNYLIFFSNEDPERIMVYKFFINSLEVMLAVHEISDMQYVAHTDFIVSEHVFKPAKVPEKEFFPRVIDTIASLLGLN